MLVTLVKLLTPMCLCDQAV